MMSNIGCLFKAIDWASNVFFRMSRKYRKICEEPGRKERTVWFGAYSIVSSILTSVFFVLCALGITAILGSGTLGTIVFFIFMIGLAMALVVLLVENVFGAILGIIYQFRCNRRAIGFIAIVVYIAVTVAMVIGILAVAGILGL